MNKFNIIMLYFWTFLSNFNKKFLEVPMTLSRDQVPPSLHKHIANVSISTTLQMKQTHSCYM